MVVVVCVVVVAAVAAVDTAVVVDGEVVVVVVAAVGMVVVLVVVVVAVCLSDLNVIIVCRAVDVAAINRLLHISACHALISRGASTEHGRLIIFKSS